MNTTLRRGSLLLLGIGLAGCPDDNPIDPNVLAADISVEGVQFTQGVQSTDGAVPLVLGNRDAVVNVRLKATSAVSESTQVVLRLLNASNAVVYSDTAVVGSVPVTAPGFDYPSVQFLLPAASLTAGLKWEVVRDPLGAQPDQSEATDRYPRGGPATLPVNAVPTLKLRFVPISLSSHGGITGNVSSANTSEYLRTLLSAMPVGNLEISVAPTLASDASFGAPPNGGESAFWQQVLSEVDAARTADAANSDAHWIGVVAPPSGFTYTAVGGMAYIPVSYAGTGGGTRSSVLVNVGWFNRPTQSRDLVAHELGHNFGRRHSPCGGPTGLDPAYPFPSGTIGDFGHDVYARSNSITATAAAIAASTADVMSYCFPQWASVYTYSGALAFRGTTAAAAPPPALAREPVLLIRGTVDGGRVTLEPAVELIGRPTQPGAAGGYTLEGLDAAGTPLFRYAVEPAQLDHTSARQFSVAVPVSARVRSDLATIRALGPAGRGAELRSTRAAGAATLEAPSPRAARTAEGVRVSCGEGARGIAVQDAETGALLALGRAGSVGVKAPPGTQVAVSCGDGVRAARSLLRAP